MATALGDLHKYNIAIIGGGYVGLVSGACFADWGHSVKIFEIDTEKRRELQNKKTPIYEPGLEKLLNQKSISFPNSLKETLEGVSVIFITVGTPTRKDGRADLDFVFQATREIASNTPKSDTPYTIIIKSTVPVGTAHKVNSILQEENPTQEFIVLSNPEFLREGKALSDCINPDRVVIGIPKNTKGIDTNKLVRQLYSPIHPDKLIFMGLESSELTKYASNAFLALKVGYINEIAELCENIGADVLDVSRGMGMDPRIGPRFLNPGPGVGGSCFPKDTSALAYMAKDHKTRFSIIDAAIDSNLRRIEGLSSKVSMLLDSNLNGAKIALLGLTFKANTDDVRASPSIVLMEDLLKLGASINACDPKGIHNTQKLINNEQIMWTTDPLKALEDCDAAVLLTEWEEFAQLKPQQMKNTLRKANVIDFRNLFDPIEMAEVGISYYAVGRPRSLPFKTN